MRRVSATGTVGWIAFNSQTHLLNAVIRAASRVVQAAPALSRQLDCLGSEARMAVIEISRREFELYALSLARGPNFEPFELVSACKSEDARSVGAILRDFHGHRFGVLTLRRKTDSRFVVSHEQQDLRTPGDAASALERALRPDDPPESLRPGEKKRPNLLKVGDRTPGDRFKLLAGTASHLPALVAVRETYLALPRPDDNFVTDFQTENFDARLWELYLVAAFREQGVHVFQDHPSPDFHLERDGHRCYVEAVTANAPVGRIPGFPPPTQAPEDRAERLLGAPAVRYAKTLRSKLQRNYQALPHVQGTPFALAIADFHAPSSMVWSAQALPCYLYGIFPEVGEGPAGPTTFVTSVNTLLGDQAIPAGLFRDPSLAHVSAVIFSNSATLGKFNRMGFLAGVRPPGLKMVRTGDLLDRTPGALKPLPFELDVLSEEYSSLWLGGEAWCQELQVFHNPAATHPLDAELLPGATHWFEREGQIVCSTIWEHTILSSVTKVEWDE